MPSNTYFSIIKKPQKINSKVVLFSVVRNESYFLPHILKHYRKLGIEEFWFLDDNSTDETRAILADQNDCGIICSDYSSGDEIDGKRFIIGIKGLVCSELFVNRWVLIVDADEFLVLPSAYKKISHLIAHMEKEKLFAARAMMVDFFPDKLSQLKNLSKQIPPFDCCSNFDVLSKLDWPEYRSIPKKITLFDSVRPRMLQELKTRGITPEDSSYDLASLHKAPLIFWRKGTHIFSAHRSNVPLSDQVQLVLAHFKFFPGYLDKIEDALQTKAYWNNSVEYQFLDVAAKELIDWPLVGSQSKKYKSAKDLEEAKLLW